MPTQNYIVSLPVWTLALGAKTQECRPRDRNSLSLVIGLHVGVILKDDPANGDHIAIQNFAFAE